MTQHILHESWTYLVSAEEGREEGPDADGAGYEAVFGEQLGLDVGKDGTLDVEDHGGTGDEGHVQLQLETLKILILFVNACTSAGT